MSRRIQIILFSAILLVVSAVEPEKNSGRWSRQLTSEDTEDWVPVQPSSSPSKRQISSRVLGQPAPFQSSFFPAESGSNNYSPQDNSRQLFLNAVPASQGFPNQQNPPNQQFLQLTLSNPQYNPLAQAFVSPNQGFQYNTQQYSQQPALSSQIVQHPASINNQLYSQSKNVFQTSQQKPFKQDAPQYVDGYKLDNVSSDYLQSISKKKQEFPPKPPQINNQKATERSSIVSPSPTKATTTTVEKEEVQLLYVPLETLQNGKFANNKQYLKNVLKQEVLRDSIGSPVQINNQLYPSTTPNYTPYQQTQLQNIQQEIIQQAFNAQSLQGKLKQNQYDRQPKYQFSSTSIYPFTQSLYPKPVITTPRSKKLKAHQPPLAVYMQQKSQEKSKLSDVLGLLKDAKSISVLDNVGPDSPKVFVGPNNLRTPENYVKFELPYLSGVDGTRIQRKVEELPFFVAPLSYKAPDGFAKIPFPAPHVGSVIINPFMSESREIGSTPSTNSIFSSFPSFNTFQQNPSTESFRTTLADLQPQKPSTFNYFSSASPNPPVLSQTTSSPYNSFSIFDQPSFNTFRPLPVNRKPEPVLSSRPPLPSYFPTTSKPTVSYFSFSSPEYNTPTTPKTLTSPNYQYRGHYITNAAIDANTNKLRTTTLAKDVYNSENIQTTQIPTTLAPNTYQPENPYTINQAFQQFSIRDSNELKNTQNNELKEYNTEAVPQNVAVENTYNKKPLSENTHFSSVNDFSPIPYFIQTTSSKPTDYELPVSNPSPAPVLNYNQQTNENYLATLNQYPIPSDGDQIENNDQFIQYQTENPTTNEITTVTSTTSTTTTPAPTTSKLVSRRPIHLRGRPRYTTQKPESDQVTRSTTRRTPTRRPSTFRSRIESTKSSTAESEGEASTDSSKKEKIDVVKTNKYSSYRSRQESESKTTTENSLPITSAATRNQRLRSRGKVHFKLTDNYEGSDLKVVKKLKKNNENDSIAYQRDVLHQNYPVTLTERVSTLDVRTSTASPNNENSDYTNSKIRIYENTSSTKKPYDSELEYYDNQPIFQGEQQKFLTQSESYVEVNGENGVSTLAPEIYPNGKEATSEKIDVSSSAKYDEMISAQIFSGNEYSEKLVKDSYKEDEKTENKQNEPEPTELPIARFRNKLKSRPKLLKDHRNDEIDNTSPLPNLHESNTESNVEFTRRSSVNLQPITYRPAFDRRRTTMRIEEIEAELKSNRKHLKSDSRSTTFKYPVYIPESTSSKPFEDSSDTNEITTKRNFIRRRPTRPTQPTVTTSTSRPVSAAYEKTNNQQTKRVRVRGRLRTRPTSTTESTNEEEQSTTDSSKYQKVSERIGTQKYSSRTRQSTHKYKRPSYNDKHSEEAVEDQTSYDSINRPEYVEYTKDVKDKVYNLEDGKAESQWSPKLSQNSFQPILNPNYITDDKKSEDIDYGTKLPLVEDNTEQNEIITARNSYDDILISVTPASNKLNEKASSVTPKDLFTSLFDSPPVDTRNEDVSTFESVLEEMMRNLEQQDEDEYDQNYDGKIRKHENGEIGAIPPDNINESRGSRKFQISDDLGLDTDIRKIHDKSESTFDSDPFVDVTAEDRAFSTTTENREVSTERQARRRGVWRKVRVRPVNKDVFQTAESQFYGNSANDLTNESENKGKQTFKNTENEEVHTEKIVTTTLKDNEQITTLPSNTNTEPITEAIANLEDVDMGTKSPEDLTPSQVKEINNENDNKNYEELELTTEFDVTTQSVIESLEKVLNKSKESYTQKSVIAEISREQPIIQTTTETPLDYLTENVENQETTETPLEEITTSIPEIVTTSDSIKQVQESEEQSKKSDEIEDKEVSTKTVQVESTTSQTNFWDPKNIISTSMSTEISHETEICYRGKCIKTKKQDFKKVKNIP